MLNKNTSSKIMINLNQSTRHTFPDRNHLLWVYRVTESEQPGIHDNNATVKKHQDANVPPALIYLNKFKHKNGNRKNIST